MLSEVKEYTDNIKEVELMVKGFKNGTDIDNITNCDIVKISKYRKRDGCTFDITNRFI